MIDIFGTIVFLMCIISIILPIINNGSIKKYKMVHNYNIKEEYFGYPLYDTKFVSFDGIKSKPLNKIELEDEIISYGVLCRENGHKINFLVLYDRVNKSIYIYDRESYMSKSRLS